MNVLKQLPIFYIGVFQIALVEADYLLMIRIHNFTTNCKECGTYFRYCVQEFNKSAECQDSYDHLHPGERLDFSREFLLRQSNPIAYWGYNWQGAEVHVRALDEHASNEVLGEASVTLTTNDIQIGIETVPVTYTGRSNITVSFAVVCMEYWYGQQCNSWCEGTNCECDLPVPCHDNCVGVVCGENRHCVDGVDIYVCTCDSGFTGKRCEINTNEGEDVDNGSENDENTSESESLVLIIGAVGWTLFISLGLVVITYLIYMRAKRTGNGGIQLEGHLPSTAASTNPMATHILHPRHNALPDNIRNEEFHQNTSYPASTHVQSSQPSATRVIACNRSNIKMTHNCAYQPEGYYDYVDETST